MTSSLKTETLDEEQFVVFTLLDELYGVDVNQVRDITIVPEIVVESDLPEFVEGISDLRGDWIAIIDLRKRFGLPTRKESNNLNLIVIEQEGISIGMIIDKVTEVLRLPVSSMEDLPNLVSDVTTDLVKAVGKLNDGTLIIIVDLEHVLSTEELKKLSEMTFVRRAD